MKKTLRSYLFVIGLSAAVVACAPANNRYDYDPLEPVNRQIFAFNEVVDTIILRPTAKAYRYVVPAEGREAIDNFLRNLREPVVAANALLQGDVQQFFTGFWRFTLNSTFGFAGFNDWAGTYANLKYRSEDFGQTLAVWGVDAGPYLVLPVLGPSTLRDTGGRLADGYADPFNYWLTDKDGVDSRDAVIARYVLTGIHEREKALDTLDTIYETSLDPYATIRSGYLQHRRALIKNMNKPDPLSDSGE